MNRSRAILLLTLILSFSALGLQMTPSRVPPEDILDGGPPRDGIPALTSPWFDRAEDADASMRPDDRVLVVSLNGETKAYPLKILNWHEVVNDTVGGRDIVVTYCPLCGTGMVFDAKVDGERLLFGVSGKLYNSNLLLYDTQTESLWSQSAMEGLTGPMSGKKLKLLPSVQTSWRAWVSRYPQSAVLSVRTGYQREYQTDPYADYRQNSRLYFPVQLDDDRLERKDWVVGIVVRGEARAYALKKLRDEKVMHDTIRKKEISLSYDGRDDTVVVVDSRGGAVPFVLSYWFNWINFHPQTGLVK